MGQSSYDNNVTLQSYKHKPSSSPIDVLIVENRDVEMERNVLSETTFTKSFPDDLNEKERTAKRRRGTESTKNLFQLFCLKCLYFIL